MNVQMPWQDDVENMRDKFNTLDLAVFDCKRCIEDNNYLVKKMINHL